ncbi:XRE family transcriptional regulator [Pseudoflavonifractor sp. 524-17]|uniref:helix-turn-helix transcriptional regulator n=1 Tax=Pseudoflavonifractor sp. 524-17 TaxID=2304577 RepID=UPI00137A8BEC|nr:helix-turn-helix transcriptional regulator [Pseudoflavonifractor sp. 524-17]NCE63482.1 XRE family transcriptional regulator [Pseudoflavonifractor sp. 524-17]
MDQSDVGRLIAQCRKEKHLTQAQLAEQLGITDQAVSKWETGKCLPDPSIMLDLCQILDLTGDELLRGTKAPRVPVEMPPPPPQERRRARPPVRRLISILFSAAVLTGIFVCLICDLALSGGLTWSPIPVSAMVFGWAVVLPSIAWGVRGIQGSLAALTLFLLPFLLLLSCLTGVGAVFSIGAVMAVLSLLFLWLIAGMFCWLGRTRPFAALGTALFLSLLLLFFINAALSRLIAEPIFDLWDGVSVFVLLILAFAAFLRDRTGRRVQ